MKNHHALPTPQKGWLPLVLIIVLTVSIFIVSIISLLSGWQTIFQNLFYFPIILACVYYVKKGFLFSVVLACSYFLLMTIFSKDPVVLEGALIRVVIFVIVAGVITYLSLIRIRAEEALKGSEEFNRGLVENMPNLVVVYDKDRKIRYVNPMATSILGYSTGEMEGTDIMTYVVPYQHAKIASATHERFSSGPGESLEVDFVTKTGQHLTVISKGAPLHFQNQPAVLMLLADISDRKRAEEELRESEERYRHLFESMMEGFAYCRMLYDDNGHPADFVYLNVNSSFNRITETANVTGKPVTEVFPGMREAYPELFEIYGRVALNGEPESFDLEFKPLNKILHISVYSPEKEHFVAIFDDITEHKLLEEETKYHEEELRQFSAALGIANKKLTLLSGITRHDINNQLTVLMGYLELLEMKQADPSFRNYFNKITNAAERIQAMIQFTKTYEGIGVNAPVWQNTRTLVDTAAKDVALDKIRLVNDIPAGMTVFADQLIVKVFFNLMDNAVRYGGKITTIRFFVEDANGDCVIVCEDDGNGISQEEKEKIFERGFGKNTGLGLFLSREILAITGITINETGKPGKGARFEMVVPKGMFR
ncbi:MAG: PAS domain S-box protein [Methanomicrobiales archaeon]